MHKRTIRLAISTIMLALVVSVPVDTAGQERGPRERAGLRQRQQQQRGRSPRASTPRDSDRRAAPRRAVPRDSDRRAAPAPRRAVPRDSTPRARPAPRDSNRRGSFRQGFGQRGSGWLGFGRGGFRSQFNFNFGLGTSQYGYTPQYYPQYYTPQYYPPYSWETLPYNGGCGWWDEPNFTVVFRGGRWVRQYLCVNMSTRNRY